MTSAMRKEAMTTKEISAVKIRARKDSFGRISVLVAHPFVESDTEHQNNSHTDESNKSINPLKTGFEDRQKNNGKEHYHSAKRDTFDG